MSERDDNVEQSFHTPTGLCGIGGCVLRPHGGEVQHSWEKR